MDAALKCWGDLFQWRPSTGGGGESTWPPLTLLHDVKEGLALLDQGVSVQEMPPQPETAGGSLPPPGDVSSLCCA